MVPSARVSGVNHGSGQESAVGGPPKAGVHGLMHIRYPLGPVRLLCILL